MVKTETSDSDLARVTIVDCLSRVLINENVKPQSKVLDYRSDITGIKPGDLDGALSFEQVQAQVVGLLQDGVILVGHGLNHDLISLKIDHRRVIDTSLIFKFKAQLKGKPSLALLSEQVLGQQMRIGERTVLNRLIPAGQHDSAEDASVTLDLAKRLITQHQCIPPLIEPPNLEVSAEDEAKLFVHRVPANWPPAALRVLFGSKHKPLAMEPLKQGNNAQFGSTHVTFESGHAATSAFQAVDGTTALDSVGRRQKTVNLDGDKLRISVREMKRWPLGQSLQ
eukprot:TRINITY_DN6910_c0_g1_i4.p1 TRINITY_DN6910_c0_g1~~TRINITY_DN6910_c0_g1_i4.p1  ORF type:complete len:281 (+),score=47.73 TRINITY_DN6910_c0_g1_i4:273-1115(+)